MATTAYKKTARTGGTAAALDGIAVAGLVDGDFAFVYVSGLIYFYIYDDDIGGTESDPTIIAPDDVGAGNGRWVLQTVYGSYDIGGYYGGVPTDELVMVAWPLPRAVTFPAGLTLSKVVASTAATAEAVVSLKKNGTEFGTATFAAAGTVATLAAASATSFAAGDILTIVAPATADATLAGIAWALAGVRG